MKPTLSLKTIVTIVALATALSVLSGCQDDTTLTSCAPCKGDVCAPDSFTPPEDTQTPVDTEDQKDSEQPDSTSDTFVGEDAGEYSDISVPKDTCTEETPGSDDRPMGNGCVYTKEYFSESCGDDVVRCEAQDLIYSQKNIIVAGVEITSATQVKAIFSAAPANAFSTDEATLAGLSGNAEIYAALKAATLWGRLNAVHFAATTPFIYSALNDAEQLLLKPSAQWVGADTMIALEVLRNINLWNTATDWTRKNTSCDETPKPKPTPGGCTTGESHESDDVRQ